LVYPNSTLASLTQQDNFYSNGVNSVNSSRFNDTFEAVYTREMFGDLPFYVIAGNHDHHSNVDAQIEYSGVDPRWNFPSYYYSHNFSWDASDGSGETRTAELLLVDTVLLCGQSDIQDPATREWTTLRGSELRGPSDELNKALADEQWSWLTERLSNSEADFLWVAGHYPIWSAGSDGTTDLLVNELLPLLAASGAHYFSGHDHMWQHLIETTSGTHMFQAGAGKECCYKDSHLSTVPEGYLQFMISGPQGNGTSIGYDGPSKGHIQGGFGSFVFGDEGVQVSFHDQDGNMLYQPPLVARRSAAQRGSRPRGGA
jgi:tartrate-resistant acid phosphatase type 5